LAVVLVSIEGMIPTVADRDMIPMIPMISPTVSTLITVSRGLQGAAALATGVTLQHTMKVTDLFNYLHLSN
jgi:hypothetical protein